MRKLTKGVYIAKEPGQDIRLWHDCKNYKGREETRVEINFSATGSDEDTAVYKCTYCDFEYRLDRNLEIG